MKTNFLGRKSVASVIIASAIGFLVINLRGCGITEQDIWKFYTELQRLGLRLPDKHFIYGEIQDQINRRIIQDKELLDYKVKREVDQAIYDYERLTGDDGRVQIAKPRYSEKAPDGSKAQELLGGEMRICALWVPDCPEENQK